MARSAVEKMNTGRQEEEEEEETETASEGGSEETNSVWANFDFTQDSNARGCFLR